MRPEAFAPGNRAANFHGEHVDAAKDRTERG